MIFIKKSLIAVLGFCFTQTCFSMGLTEQGAAPALAEQEAPIPENPIAHPSVHDTFFALPENVRKQFFYQGTYHVPHSLEDLRETLKTYAVTKLLYSAQQNPNADSKSSLQKLAKTLHKGQAVKEKKPYRGNKENQSAILNTALANAKAAFEIDIASPHKLKQVDPAQAAQEKKAAVLAQATAIENKKNLPGFNKPKATPACFLAPQQPAQKPLNNKRKQPSQ